MEDAGLAQHRRHDAKVDRGFQALACPGRRGRFCASVEIAARLRGGHGPFGWIRALPWQNPIMLALAFSFVLLGFGGAGGLINMSYQLDTAIHNTQWITGHFHLIFGGATLRGR